MESYVTSYSGAEDATKQAMTQEKLNSCIKSLHDLVDTFEPLETVQEYGEMIIEDQDYYEGFNKQFDIPQGDIPIIVPICNLNLKIGVLDSKGVFTATRPIEMTSSSGEFRIIGVTSTYYRGPDVRGGPYEPPPDMDDYRPHNTDLIVGTDHINDTVTGINGEVVSRLGDITRHNAVSYSNLHIIQTEASIGYADWAWEGIQQNYQYSVGTIDVTVDLSDFKINIRRRYKKNVSRTSAN